MKTTTLALCLLENKQESANRVRACGRVGGGREGDDTRALGTREYEILYKKVLIDRFWWVTLLKQRKGGFLCQSMLHTQLIVGYFVKATC